MIPASVAAVLERIREIDARVGAPSGVAFAQALALAAERTAAAPSAPDLPEGERALVERAAREAGVDPALAMAVVVHESGGNPHAVSPAGAMGLMQLMPQTARELGVSDPFDPEQNVRAGVRSLREKIDEFGSVPLALAAYNAGSGAVLHFGGIPPYPETWRFVDAVLRTASDLASSGQQTATGAAAAGPSRGRPSTSSPDEQTAGRPARPEGTRGTGRSIRSHPAVPASDGAATAAAVQGNEQGADATTGAVAGDRLPWARELVHTRGEDGSHGSPSQQRRPDPPAAHSGADTARAAARGEAPDHRGADDGARQARAGIGERHGRLAQAGSAGTAPDAAPALPADADQALSPPIAGDAGAASLAARHIDRRGHDGGTAGGGQAAGAPGTRGGHSGAGPASPRVISGPDGPFSGTPAPDHAAQRDTSAAAPDRPAHPPRPGAVHVTVRIGGGDRPVDITVVGRAQDVAARVVVPTRDLGQALEARAGDLRSALASHRIRLSDLVVTPASGEAGRERGNGPWSERRGPELGPEEDGA